MPDQSQAEYLRLLEELRLQMGLPPQPMQPTRAPQPTVAEILASIGGNRDWQNQMPVVPSRGPMGPTRISAAPPPVPPTSGPMGPTRIGPAPTPLSFGTRAPETDVQQILASLSNRGWQDQMPIVPGRGPMGPTRIGPAGAGPAPQMPSRGPMGPTRIGPNAAQLSPSLEGVNVQDILDSMGNRGWQDQMPVTPSRGPMGPTRIGPAGAAPPPQMPGRGPMGPTRIGPNAVQLPPQLEGVTAQSIIDSISPTLSKFRQSQSPVAQVMAELERARRGEPEDPAAVEAAGGVPVAAPATPTAPTAPTRGRTPAAGAGRPAGTRSTPVEQAKSAIGKLPSMPFDHEQLHVPISPEDLGLSRESVPNIIGAGAGGTALHGGVLPFASTKPINAGGPLNAPISVKPAEIPTAAPKPMPAWKQVLAEAFRSLPSAMVHFAAAKFDRPDIADNWLKQRALKIQAAQEAAELEAKTINDAEMRRLKLLEIQQGKNGTIQSITNRITDLHGRVAEGKLKDIESYFSMLQAAANDIQALGGDGQAFMDAFPVPMADRFDTLRKQFTEYTEKFGFDDRALDAAPFIDPLDETNKRHLTGHTVARILGQIDPTTKRAILPLPDLTKVEEIKGGKPQMTFKTPTELRSQQPFTPIPPPPPSPQYVNVQTIDEAGNIQVTQVDPQRQTQTPPVKVSGVSTSIATDITGAQRIAADTLRKNAAIAILTEETGAPPSDQDANKLQFSTNKTDQAKLAKKMAELQAEADKKKRIR